MNFPPRRNRVTFTDDPLEIKIPLDENRKGPETKVVISLALSRDQLNFNRSNTKTGLHAYAHIHTIPDCNTKTDLHPTAYAHSQGHSCHPNTHTDTNTAAYCYPVRNYLAV